MSDFAEDLMCTHYGTCLTLSLKYSGFPTQPVEIVDGVLRFKENRIVSRFLGAAQAGEKFDLNDLAKEMEKYDPWEYQQFLQLIGYSVSGIPHFPDWMEAYLGLLAPLEASDE